MVFERHIFEESQRLFIGLESYLVNNKELITKAIIIEADVMNIIKESILLRFQICIFFSKGLQTAIESGKQFHIIKKAPQEERNSDINIDLIPLDLILLILTEYSAESDVLSLFFLLKIIIDTKDPIIPKAYIDTALRNPLSNVYTALVTKKS